jgi:hypothetical protein
MEKSELTHKIAKWLEVFLTKKLSNSHEILDIIIPESNLSKLPNKYIKSCNNYSSWEFKSDVLGILKNKKTNKIELVLVNRSTSALSLKEIGEIYCYSKLVDSIQSFLVSLNGVSNEVNILLLEDTTRNRLLNYNDDRKIIIFSWDEKNDGINPNSIIPIDKKNLLLN